MNYFKLVLRLWQGRVLSISKNPWISNVEYEDKINWLIEQGYAKKVKHKRSVEIKYLVITTAGIKFLKDQKAAPLIHVE